MKALLFMSLFALSVLTLPAVNATAAESSDTPAVATEIPTEISALMLTPEYAAILAAQTQAATESGRTLQIQGYAVLDFGSSKFASVSLISQVSADPWSPWMPAGAIVGSVKYGPLGEVIFDGIYFKPADELPGGASVGNHSAL